MNSENHFRMFAEKMSDDSLRNMKVTMTTNAQTIEYKGQSLIPRWQKLKRFVYRISIDGTEETYPYVRSGGKFEKVTDSISKVREAFNDLPGKLMMVSTVAVSLYNITRLSGLIEFAAKNGTLLHFNLVHFPHFLSIDNLSIELRDRALRALEQNLEEINSSEFWQRHPVWSQSLKLDYDFEVYRSLIEAEIGPVDPEDLTYSSYAKVNYSKQIKEVIAALESVNGSMKGAREFSNHVSLLDRINNTNFLDVFPEYSNLVNSEKPLQPTMGPA